MALDQYGQGNLDTARAGFEDFLVRNPNHNLAPDAQYYIARTWEEQGDVAQALNAYRRVTELYPDSNRAPAALLQRGKIEAGRGNIAMARQLFTQIRTGYGNSPEASLAETELRRLPPP